MLTLAIKQCILGVLIVATFISSAFTAAQQMDRQGSNPPSTPITEEKAYAIAQQRVDGRVLAINLIDSLYRIKILDSGGRMHILSINSHNGAITQLDHNKQ